MKIQQHPRMRDIAIGDEVVCYHTNLYACVEEVFPAAVCVKLAVLHTLDEQSQVEHVAQLWRADDIENISICRYCGSRDDLIIEQYTGIPLRICTTCRSVLSPMDEIVEALPMPYGEKR
jgi:hypothetical protein